MEELPFSRLHHVGSVVRDLDKAIEYYRSLGIGPFESLNATSIDRQMYGKPITVDSIKLRTMLAKIGAIEFELIQPVKGETPQQKYLDNKGEGINHLGFIVDDIEKETEKLIKKGFKVIYRTRFKGGGGGTLFDTSEIGGVMFQLYQSPPG